MVELAAGGSHPRVRFAPPESAPVTFSGGGLIFGFHVGDTAQILYAPSDPAGTATLSAPGSLYFYPIILGFIGVMSLLVAASHIFF